METESSSISKRHKKENTKEITLLFLVINVKTEGLGNQNEEDTIMNVKRKKGPSFVPTPTDINWCNLRQDFDTFVNKLRFHALKTEKKIM